MLSCYNNYDINMENEVRMKKSKLKKILGFSGVVILIIATFIFFYLKTNSYHPTSEALKISQKAEVQYLKEILIKQALSFIRGL